MKKIITAILLGTPLISYAAFTGFRDLILATGGLVQLLILLVGAAAVLFFFWGLAKFILNAGSETAKDEGKRIMIWGIIALFVMISIWGIIGFLQASLLSGGAAGDDFYSGRGYDPRVDDPDYGEEGFDPFCGPDSVVC